MKIDTFPQKNPLTPHVLNDIAFSDINHRISEIRSYDLFPDGNFAEIIKSDNFYDSLVLAYRGCLKTDKDYISLQGSDWSPQVEKMIQVKVNTIIRSLNRQEIRQEMLDKFFEITVDGSCQKKVA